MYRIRSASGLETNFASLEEFTEAVRRGGVSENDQIFHSRADRWLEVKSHPHYRSALQGAPVRESSPARSTDAAPGRTQVMPRPMLRPEGPASGDGFEIISDGLESPIRNSGAARAPVAAAEPRVEPKPRDAVRVIPRVVLQKPIATEPRASAGVASPPPPQIEASPPKAVESAPAPVAEIPSAKPVEIPPAKPVERPPAKPADAAPRPAPAPAPAGDVANEAKPSVVAAPVAAPPVVAPPAESDRPLRSEHAEPLLQGTRAGSAASNPGHASPRHFVIGGVIVAVVAAVALLVWRPWVSATPEAVAAQTLPESAVQTPAKDPALQEFAASVVAAAAAQPPSPAAQPAPSEPQVLAAVKPALDMNTAVPAPDVELNVPAAPAVAVPPSELARRVAAAEAQARADLDRRLGSFTDLFAPARLGATDGVREIRSSWVTAGDAIRGYRAAIARLESAYGDSLLLSQRTTRWPAAELRAWNARPGYAESAETSQISDLMIDQVTEALDLLVSSKGAWQLKNGRIQFTAAADAARYAIIQGWIANRQQQWSATPAATRPATLTRLLTALGAGLPLP